MNISDATAIKILPFESAVLDGLVAQKNEDLSPEDISILNEQMKGAIILSRTMTGVGFYTKFLVDKKAQQLDKKSLQISGVGANISGVEHGAGFILFIKEGVIDNLEGFTYAEDRWPDPWPSATPLEWSIFEIPNAAA